MADQVQAAKPVTKKKPLFGQEKKADIIIYRMIKRNDKLRDDTPPYPPYHRFPNTDVITWNWGTEKEPDWGERAIRWLPGEQSIFIDEQEKNGREIPESKINNPGNRFEILEGEIKVRTHEKTKQQFLDLCNRNEESPNRTGRTTPIFVRYTEEKVVQLRAEKLEKQQDALEKAFAASDAQVVFHARYLGIPTLDGTTGATRTEKAIKTDYRQKAMDDPEGFIKTYDDEDLKVKFYIERAIEDNVISLTLFPGKVVWTGSKEEICDVQEGSTPIDSIFNFGQLRAGEKMIEKLKELNK